jgi:hypothetical protein
MLLVRSAAEAGLPQDAEFAAAFNAYLEWGSWIAVEDFQAGVRRRSWPGCAPVR